MARPRAIFMYHEKSSHTPHTLQAIRQREQSVSVLFQSSLSELYLIFGSLQRCPGCSTLRSVQTCVHFIAYGASKAQGHFCV